MNMLTKENVLEMSFEKKKKKMTALYRKEMMIMSTFINVKNQKQTINFIKGLIQFSSSMTTGTGLSLMWSE